MENRFMQTFDMYLYSQAPVHADELTGVYTSSIIVVIHDFFAPNWTIQWQCEIKKKKKNSNGMVGVNR